MTNFSKLNEEMGFQRSSALDKQKVQPISTKVVKNDENSGDLSLSSIASYLHDISTIVNAPIPSSDLAYSSWVVEHPSALGSFDRMMKVAKGKRIVVFLDYDGILSPIVDDPDRAFMSNEIKGFVQLSNVYYAGSHGMDIMVPPKPLKPCDLRTTPQPQPWIRKIILQGSVALFQAAKRFQPAIQEISILLEEIARKIEGARVEDNRFCISVHYRKVWEEDYGILEEKVKSVGKNYPEFHLTDNLIPPL